MHGPDEERTTPAFYQFKLDDRGPEDHPGTEGRLLLRSSARSELAPHYRDGSPVDSIQNDDPDGWSWRTCCDPSERLICQ